MRCRILVCVCVAALAFLGSTAMANPIYRIDINSGAAAPSPTAPGWTGLPQGGSVTLDGIKFEVFSQAGWRDRGGPNDLTRDFAFDGGPNTAVGLKFGAAGALRKGTWEVQMWSWDDDFPTGVGPQIARWRRNNAEHHVASNVMVDPVNPVIKFQFESDGIGFYDVFLRENSGNNRTRLNAVTLEFVPEPATIVLGLIGGVGVVLRRRRKS